ncbi:hypothetical protein KC219_20800, partial [Mycobacterium tuberculosis]|nr:hypothetical protein [Mycobacterium tuberculosis]
EFTAELPRKLNRHRLGRIKARPVPQHDTANCADLDFPPETKEIREDETWQVAPPAPGLEDRRVEVTGPTYKKMTLNALNSGAKVWLADQEDANTPQWDSVIGGQINLLDALTREIDFTSPEGKESTL